MARIAARGGSPSVDEQRELMQASSSCLAVAEWLVKADARVKFVRWAVSAFPGAFLLEDQAGIEQISIRVFVGVGGGGGGNGGGGGLGKLFGTVERGKGGFPVQEYSITPTTLEQIFNQFTRESQLVMLGLGSAGVAGVAGVSGPGKNVEPGTIGATAVGPPVVAAIGSGDTTASSPVVGIAQPSGFGEAQGGAPVDAARVTPEGRMVLN